MAKILLVDDDARLSEIIDDWLTAEEHNLICKLTASEGWTAMSSEDFDVIVLDWNLPDGSGPELCERFRALGKTTPVIMLTGRTSIECKVTGLDSGADDYLTKPFNPQELSARVRALVRRFSKPTNEAAGHKTMEEIELAGIKLNSKARTVYVGERQVNLMPREFDLLEFFMQNPEQVFSANEIMDNVWSQENESSPDTVRVHITKLRSKLGHSQEDGPIKTLHRVGYKFSPG